MPTVPAFACGLAVLALSQAIAPAGRQAREVQTTLAGGAVMPAVTRVAPMAPLPELGAAARVRLEVVIDEKGSLAHTRVIDSSGPAGIVHAVIDALHQSEFRPAMRGPRPATTLAEMEATIDPARAGAIVPRVRLTSVAAAEPLAEAPDAWAKAYDSDTKGLVPPRSVRRVLPMYTPEAMRAKIMGAVELDVVILEDGTVGATRVRESLDASRGLDRQALISARHWLFAPATLNGRPVPVSVVVVLEFRLH